MSESKLKTAILGLDEGGRMLLEAAGRLEYFNIQAVADKDTNLVEKIADEHRCRAYDDYRQLIIQNQLDCLLVAASMHSCDEYVKRAMKKRFHVLKLAPAARNFEEAAEFVHIAEEEGIQFAVANPGRFAKSFLTLRQFLQQSHIEQVFLLKAFCNVGDYTHYSWQTDWKLAGGGVLLHNCYRLIDQILWNFDMPQQVYSLNTNPAQDKQQRLYLTEDTAVVTMKFSDTFIGNLIASRRAGIRPKEEYLRLYGKDKILSVGQSRLTISDENGRISDELNYDDEEIACMTELLKNFALSILAPEENKLISTGRDNLRNMAVMESAYLSARTGFPEEPARILQMAAGGT